WTLPAREVRVPAAVTQLDRFAPAYQFNEVHTIQVRASRERVYRAIKSVTPDEIKLFRTLTWIRRFGRPGPASILNPPPGTSLLDIATRSGFIVLAEEPGHEVVLGTVVIAPRGLRPRRGLRSDDFTTLHAPGFAFATMNFLVEETSPDVCTVSTETRIYATDAGTRR